MDLRYQQEWIGEKQQPDKKTCTVQPCTNPYRVCTEMHYLYVLWVSTGTRRQINRHLAELRAADLTGLHVVHCAITEPG